MLFVVIPLGFMMLTLGVALLFLGEVPFVAGKRIPAIRSRLIGSVLVAFLPLAWLIKMLSDVIFGREAVEGPVVTALTFSFCCVLIIAILFRVLIPKQEPRPPAATRSSALDKKNPFGDEEPIEILEVEPTPAKKPRKGAASDKNPFDFG